MKGYKGFDKDLKCMDKQYEIGKTYEEPDAILCKKGLHFCELPHDIFSYYHPGEGRFAEVDANGVSDAKDDDSKRVCKKLRIDAEISAFKICKIAVSAFFEHFEFKRKIGEVDITSAANAGDRGAANAGDWGAANAGDFGAANAGDWGAANAGYQGAANAGDRGAANAGNFGAANAGNFGAANAGDRGAANAGNFGAANAGDRGAANAGDRGAANAGDRGAANAGDFGAANAGDWGAANAGYQGAANAGDRGAAVVRHKGAASTGREGVAIGMGRGCKVKGGIGALLVLTACDDGDNITGYKTRLVDGEKIKADTYYTLKNGRVVEAGK